jgi:glycosyltransferase involved in cell wall biosynthesis
LLLQELPNIELHVFGAGDYKEAEYDRYLNHLNLNEKVFFRGHQEDMKKTLNEENLNLVWFQGYLNRPAGYAGQDVSVTGTPMLLWDFYTGVNPNINDINYVYPHYKNIKIFKEESKKVLLDKKTADIVAKKQYFDVIETKNIKKNINVIKDFLNS